ncbi:MAG: hypothetical protein KatS3mg051_2145 [Anaerolineae bacterium]|nr:MAG: hypothetical protein KatS3mg051_1816 [Anaerolineae bacterium]GIV82791.1 MAG: hypothetical protein KatS3mg051_2145 [Anaerolineae bacterium]
MPKDFDQLLRELGKFFAPRSVMAEVDRLRAWKGRLELDTSFGRVATGPQWLSGVSILDGSVEAGKLSVSQLSAITAETGSLLVTDRIVASISGSVEVPWPGLEILATGQLTMRNAGAQATITFNSDGSAQFGIGPSAFTIASNGTVSIPAGAIAGGLTIANISSGKIGGTYYTSDTETQYPRLELAPTGLRLWNSSGTRLIDIGAGTFEIVTGPQSAARLLINQAGAYVMPANDTDTSNALVSMTPTGFTVKSSLGNPRLEMGSSGIKGYDSAGTQTLDIDTAGRLKLESGGGVKIRLTTASGAAATNGFFIENGSNPVVALRGDGSGRLGLNGEITWDVINGLSITASAIRTGTLNCQNLTVTNLSVSNITGGTIGGNYATGSNKIIFGDDYLTDNIIHFKVPTEAAVVRFRPFDDNSFPSGHHGRSELIGECSDTGGTGRLLINAGAYNGTNLLYKAMVSAEAYAASATASLYAEGGGYTSSVDVFPGAFSVRVGPNVRMMISTTQVTLELPTLINGSLTATRLEATTNDLRIPYGTLTNPGNYVLSDRYIQVYDSSGNPAGVIRLYVSP